MKTAIIRDKHLKLDQRKIEMAKKILKTKTETEAIEKALELVITEDIRIIKKKELLKRILARRERLGVIKGDVADLVREGRGERERIYE